MSGLVKGVKKVFKKVGDFVKKVVAPVLAVAAIVFTGGAALGLPGMAAAGGWGGAVAKGIGALGINTAGTVGKVLVGAVTQAGYGAAVGGVTAAVTGGSFAEGAAKGAMVGAVTGGVMGGMGMQTDPFAKAFGRNAAATNPANQVNTAASTSAPATGLGRPAATASTQAVSAAPVAQGVQAASAAAPAAPTGLGRFMQSPAGAMTIMGLGQGLLKGQAVKDAEDARLAEENRIRGSYDGAGQAMRFDDAPDAGQTPSQPGYATYQPAPRADGTGRRLVFNPETGRIERVEVA